MTTAGLESPATDTATVSAPGMRTLMAKLLLAVLGLAAGSFVGLIVALATGLLQFHIRC